LGRCSENGKGERPMRQRPKSLKSKAKLPVAPKSAKSDGARVRDLEKRLAEALKRESEAQRQLQTRDRELVEADEQQTATSEILRVISRSPTDVQPVFDAIVESAVRLCDARYGAVFNFDGDLVHLMAHHNFSETALEAFREQYPMRPTRAHISGRAILSGSVVQIPDVALDPEYGSPHTVPQGFRSLRAAPILRGGAPIGAIVIYRPESGTLSDEQISLLQTFAAQAVIAIENVRLFKELQARTGELTQSVEKL